MGGDGEVEARGHGSVVFEGTVADWVDLARHARNLAIALRRVERPAEMVLGVERAQRFARVPDDLGDDPPGLVATELPTPRLEKAHVR